MEYIPSCYEQTDRLLVGGGGFLGVRIFCTPIFVTVTEACNTRKPYTLLFPFHLLKCEQERIKVPNEQVTRNDTNYLILS